MTAGFGADPTKDGTGAITSGTTSQDIRKVNGGLYTPGVISGCKVTLSTVGMTYQVSAGVAAIQMATGEVVLAPIPATTISASTVSSTGGRTDYIYAYQNTPAVEGNSNVVVTYGSSVPSPRALKLDSYTQPAGATVTSSGSRAASVDYAIPYSGGLGRLWYYQYTLNGTLNDSTTTATRIGNGTFYIPTDRMVKWTVSAVLSANNASGFDNSKYCEYGFLPNADGTDFAFWTTPGLHQAWGTFNWSSTIQMTAGQHTANLGLLKVIGPGSASVHYGTDNQGLWRRGLELTIEDAGAVQ